MEGNGGGATAKKAVEPVAAVQDCTSTLKPLNILKETAEQFLVMVVASTIVMIMIFRF